MIWYLSTPSPPPSPPQAADKGDSFTCNASNTAKGGTSISVTDMERVKNSGSGQGEIVRGTATDTSKISKKELRDAKKKAKQDQREQRKKEGEGEGDQKAS